MPVANLASKGAHGFTQGLVCTHSHFLFEPNVEKGRVALPRRRTVFEVMTLKNECAWEKISMQ